MNDDESLSIWLSDQMHRAGFRSANARIQSAMASVLEDLLGFLLKTDSVYVFGSFSDGWGSCLEQLDGSIEPSSDIDVTIMSGKRPIHPVSRPSCDSGCRADHTLAEYENGHIVFRSGPKPNFDIKKSDLGMVDAFDIIVALDCCAYPSIELLKDGYKTRKEQESNMSTRIMELLRAEVFGDSPRCHVVAASPPNLPAGSYMRVSTTLLERSVMQNLTDIQGQFFIIIKFLIKRVISERTVGMKTYMAKNLLFYMLDETPTHKWESSNLIELVRASLKMLVEMMESTDSDDVCMIHFFLRDANVYFKKDHRPKAEIISTLKQILKELHTEIERFADSLTENAVREIHFHAFFALHLIAEIQSFADNENPDIVIQSVGEVRDAHKAISIGYSGVSADKHLENLLAQVSNLPDCVRVSKDWLKALAYLRVGKSLETEAIEFPIGRGILCPPDGQETQFDEAKAAVLRMLQEPNPMGVQVQNGKIVNCALKKELSPLASFVKSMREGSVPRIASLFGELLRSSPLLPMLISYRRVEQPRAMANLLNLTRHLRTIVSSESPALPIEDDLD